MNDLTGNRYGSLVVIKRVENTKSKQAMWECLCDCGKFRKVRSDNLSQGRTRSCGSHAKSIKNDLTGERFGKLTVIEFYGKDNNHKAQWSCLCDCGKKTIKLEQNLKSGIVKGCGWCKRKVFQ